MGTKKPQWFLPVRARLLQCPYARKFLGELRWFLGVGARWLSIGGFFKRSAEKKPSGDEAENKVRKPLAPQGCLKL